MSRGINRVILSGNVVGDRAEFSPTGNGTQAFSFKVASDRPAGEERTLTAFVRVNVYADSLVRTCKDRIKKGAYVIVEGELMNRDGQHGELTEVRAKDLIFP